MNTTFVEQNRDRMLDELSELLTIPSISTTPERAGDVRRAADWVMRHLRSLGCPVVALIEGDGHPVVWAESPHVPDRPTLLIYGHYDVQPPDPLDEWTTPPFEPSVRDGRLYARGAADDKGQVYCLLKAYEAACDGGAPPCNVHFIFEGEEECGGQVIFDLLKREPARTDVDAVLVCDADYYARGWPAVYSGLRGMCYTEIAVRTLQSDLHSGSYGGVAPNAIETLTRILAELKSADGRIRIPGLYKMVRKPSKAELKAWKKLPFDEKAFRKDEVTSRALTGREDYTVLERVWALPTLEIHGIRGGFTGEGAKTVIPAQATAKVSLRLVPGHSVRKVFKLLRAQVRKLAPKWADVEVRLIHGGEPIQLDLDAPVFALLGQAFEEVVGRAPVPVRSGGSIPVVTSLAARGAPVVLTGIGLPDDRLHAPNEKLDLTQLWDGVKVFGRFMELFGQQKAGGSRQ